MGQNRAGRMVLRIEFPCDLVESYIGCDDGVKWTEATRQSELAPFILNSALCVYDNTFLIPYNF